MHAAAVGVTHESLMYLVMVGTTAPSHVYPSLALIAELVARGRRRLHHPRTAKAVDAVERLVA
jgi:hypothetical protein